MDQQSALSEGGGTPRTDQSEGRTGKLSEISFRDELIPSNHFSSHFQVMAAREATGEVLIFLDSHCEVSPGWMEPLLAPIEENPKRYDDLVRSEMFEIRFQGGCAGDRSDQCQYICIRKGRILMENNYQFID